MAVDQGKIEFMISFQQSRRINQIGAPHGVENVGHRDACRKQLGRIWGDMKFRLLPALHDHCGDAFQTVEPRFHFISCRLPQPGLGHAVRGQAVTDDGKSSEREAVSFDLCGGRKLWLHARNGCIDVLQRLEHVDVPAEIEIDFGGSTTGNRAHGEQSRHAVDGLLNGAGHGDRHLIDGHDPVIDGDQHAGKIRGREHRHRDREGEIRPQQPQRQNDEDHRPGVLGNPMLP